MKPLSGLLKRPVSVLLSYQVLELEWKCLGFFLVLAYTGSKSTNPPLCNLFRECSSLYNPEALGYFRIQVPYAIQLQKFRKFSSVPIESLFQFQ